LTGQLLPNATRLDKEAAMAEAEEKKPHLFSAYRVVTPKTPLIPYGLKAYLIESTAPDNIDDKTMDTDNNSGKYAGILEPLKVDGEGGVLDEIANALNHSPNPSLVISVHGFNNPRDVILPTFWESFKTVHKDMYINNTDTVCIGYRWPSEALFSPRHTIFDAAPKFLTILFKTGIVVLLVLVSILLLAWYGHDNGLIQHESFIIIDAFDALMTILFTLGLIAIPFTLFILRVAVYFRDGYRATSFGIPDLVEIIRQIDKKLAERHNRSWPSWIGIRPKNQVQLSFIAHSMGAYVVTSAVRILSDVFDPATMRRGLNSTQFQGVVPNAKELSKIGHAFCLKRLVLVSPDIPAEALISNRANFLSNSLVRFEEAFLFSNEGDEVLRQISTTANYFSFPTRSSSFGYRLGNVCLLGLQPGINREKFNQSYLEIGGMTLSELNTSIEKDFGRDLAKRFTYFDCTDCVDIDAKNNKARGMLTLAKLGVFKKMRSYDHLWLLFRYLRYRRPDVHGGYFDSSFLTLLIYRLVCIGYKDTEKAFAKDGATLHTQCKDHQVRALLKF
jgi:esterase/lipase superfamily enzyme